MSDSQSSGFKGFLWSVAAVWVGAAGPSIAGWIFPSVDDFFAKSGRALSGIWAFLTATWSVPAVPLLLGIAIAAVAARIMLVRIRTLASQVERSKQPPLTGGRRVRAEVAATTDPARFSKAEQSILGQLLYADRNMKDAGDVAYGAQPIPQLVVQVAAKSLLDQGLIAHQRSHTGFGFDYLLTPAGKELVLDAWNAQNA